MLDLHSNKHKPRRQLVLSFVACGRRASIYCRDMQSTKTEKLGIFKKKKKKKTHDGLTANLNQDKNQDRND